jgi:hypothetical protein
MAFSHGSTAKAFANGVNLSRYLRSVGASGVRDVAETSGLSSTAKEYIPGLKDATLSGEGMFDGTAGASDPILAAALGASAESVWTVFPASDTIGNRGIGISCHHTQYEVTSPVDDVNMLTVEANSNVGQESIIAHSAHGTVTASGTASATVDGAAQSTGGGAGYLHAIFAGTGTFTVKLQDSADDSTYADKQSFTALSAGTAAQRVAVSGTVARYTRVVWTMAGSGTAAFQASFGRA